MKRSIILMATIMFVTCLMVGTSFAQKTYKMRLATVVTPPHPWTIAADFMAKEIEARTNGAVKLTIHASSGLGSDQTTIDEMRMGTIDFVIGGTAPASAFVPEYQIFSLPYLFKNYDRYKRVTAVGSPVFKQFEKLYSDKKLGIKLLALGGGGVRNTSTNLKPIVTPADMKGMKMRVTGNPIVTKVWSATGAMPSPLPWKEIYSAIQTGVVNTFDSSVSGYYGSRYYEVAPFHAKTEHQFMTSHISMSNFAYKKLPAEYQKIVIQVAAEAGVLITDKGKEFDSSRLKELVEKYNVKVNEVDKEAFDKLFTPLQDELAASVKLTNILKTIRSVK